MKKTGGGRQRSRSRSAGAESCESLRPLAHGIFVGPSRIEAVTTKFDALYLPPPKKKVAQPEPKGRRDKQSKIDVFMKRRVGN